MLLKELKMKLIAGLKGEYYFFDRAAHSINEKGRVEFHRNYMGFIFQAFHLIDKMTVYQNI